MSIKRRGTNVRQVSPAVGEEGCCYSLAGVATSTNLPNNSGFYAFKQAWLQFLEHPDLTITDQAQFFHLHSISSGLLHHCCCFLSLSVISVVRVIFPFVRLG